MPAPSLRLRSSLLWVLFVLAAGATALAVYQLYATARQEIATQSARALDQEKARVLERVRRYTEEIRRSTLIDLVSFHIDGLDHTLRQWDGANDIIVGTFIWDPAHGFPANLEIPRYGPAREELAQLWQQFRAWRATHPSEKSMASNATGPFQTIASRTTDNPAWPETELGYQAENLEMLTHAGGTADPWAGWAVARSVPNAPWIFWYQTGPSEPVRGCFVDSAPILRQLRGELTDPSFAKIELAESAPNNTVRTESLPGLPAWHLNATAGEIFRRKESTTRFTALITALLFGLFLGGGAILVARTRRESRDAERKITFVAQVSHELRTPLTSIRMFGDMLAAPDLPAAKREKFSHTISAESRRLEVLIERLLTFNTLERGQTKIIRVPLDVAALVLETVEEMDSTLRAAGLKITLDLPAGPVIAVSDHSAVKQALLNLLDNATKYAPESGAVRLQLGSDSNRVRLTVADNGPGIPRAIRDRLFEPFVQGGQTLTSKAPGVGLGLSLARGMLRQAGGELVLLATATGAVFEISLPGTPNSSPLTA